MYLFAAAACLASWTYATLIAHAHGNYPYALLMAALLATAMHVMKSAETA